MQHIPSPHQPSDVVAGKSHKDFCRSASLGWVGGTVPPRGMGGGRGGNIGVILPLPTHFRKILSRPWRFNTAECGANSGIKNPTECLFVCRYLLAEAVLLLKALTEVHILGYYAWKGGLACVFCKPSMKKKRTHRAEAPAERKHKQDKKLGRRTARAGGLDGRPLKAARTARRPSTDARPRTGGRGAGAPRRPRRPAPA